ncbi:MAG: protein chain release factor [Planctomycetaceae bacterium]|nr:protein chain release factor [Planctomycetaceae bacterium]
MPFVHPAAMSPEELLRECDVQRTRRSGPGGQHRNKVESAVVLTHRPSGAHAEASERRSQAENLAVALFRMRMQLALDVRSQLTEADLVDEAGRSELWKSRCVNHRIHINSEHTDFPTLLAEALDVLHAMEMDLGLAAEKLNCTTSQLIKFFQQDPRALASINQDRLQRGLHKLK